MILESACNLHKHSVCLSLAFVVSKPQANVDGRTKLDKNNNIPPLNNRYETCSTDIINELLKN